MELNNQLQELSSRLDTVEDTARRHLGSEAAQAYAAAVMRELISPLEILNNLMYVAGHIPGVPEAVALYIGIARDELIKINQVTQRTLRFCSENRPGSASA